MPMMIKFFPFFALIEEGKQEERRVPQEEIDQEGDDRQIGNGSGCFGIPNAFEIFNEYFEVWIKVLLLKSKCTLKIK